MRDSCIHGQGTSRCMAGCDQLSPRLCVPAQQLEEMQTASKGKPKDEVTHIGMMRRRLARSLNSLRHPQKSSQAPVKPTAANLAANTAQQVGTSLAVGSAEDEDLARAPDPEAAAANLARVSLLVLLPFLGAMLGLGRLVLFW